MDIPYDVYTRDAERDIIRKSKAERSGGDAQKKLREAVQSNEQTRINKYHEGFCYGCAKVDRNISTLVYICPFCRAKRGVEGLMAIAAKKYADELCDFCGRWSLGVWQINCSLCRSCMRITERIHRQYRKSGGYINNNPYMKRQKKTHGKTWYQDILESNARKLPI